ncbi:Monooxygenase FAD-binding [Penicillium concentricum]|uniref:Monooxygenase FAD-binding n=1 Tax=Penicillium concentricum TaxID=293559 RepID=A0A9W9VB34_9EURO|nr:Monooxygenase FAD-binding [Penicillium concentricum]KAJ5374169.1 Monooxygenase FAD-binding [Penicillium concentricum]
MPLGANVERVATSHCIALPEENVGNWLLKKAVASHRKINLIRFPTSSTTKMAEKLHQYPFRVIIVGGSVAGLTLANTLSRKNIDFLVLETRDAISPCPGAAICLLSHGTRTLDQMGILDDVIQLMTPKGVFHTWQGNGRLLSKLDTLNVLQTRHGYPAGWIDREKLLQILFNHLHEKEKVLLRKRFVKAEHSAEGIIAHCSDGSLFKGDIIIGADGVHSLVRQSMWQHMKYDGLEGILNRDATAMTAQYSCVYGVSKAVTGIEDGIVHRTIGRGFSLLLAPGTKGILYWYLTAKMDKRYQSPHIPRYDRYELEAHIGRYMDQELKRQSTSTGHGNNLPALEIQYTRRTTPTLGLGANTAIEDAASLANCMASMLESESASCLSVEVINLYLSSWAAGRGSQAKAICITSNILTRFETLATWRHKIIMLHIIPHLGDIIADLLSYFIVGSEGLDSIPPSTRSLETAMPFRNLDQKANASEWKHLATSDALRLRLQSIALYCLGKFWG